MIFICWLWIQQSWIYIGLLTFYSFRFFFQSGRTYNLPVVTNCIPVFPVSVPFIFLLAYYIIDILGKMMKRETFLKQPKHSSDNVLTFTWTAATSRKRLQITIYCFFSDKISACQESFREIRYSFIIQRSFLVWHWLSTTILLLVLELKKGTGNKIHGKPHAH